MTKIKVFVAGKEEMRQIECIEQCRKDEPLPFRIVPKTRPGEEIVRMVDGLIHIMKGQL